MKKIFIFLFFIVFSYSSNFECINCQNFYPAKVKKVYASNPVLLYQFHAINKEKAAGLVFEFWDIEKEFLDSKFTSLPVVDGFFGQGRTPNIKQVLSLKPDLILASTNTKEHLKTFLQR